MKDVKEIIVKLYKDEMGFNTNMHLAYVDDKGNMYVAKPVKLEFEEFDYKKIQEPFLQFSYNIGNQFLKQLSNALIEMGYRDKLTNADNEIKRMENHINDLQKVLNKSLE